MFAMIIMDDTLSVFPKESLTNIMMLGGVLETHMANQMV